MGTDAAAVVVSVCEVIWFVEGLLACWAPAPAEAGLDEDEDESGGEGSRDTPVLGDAAFCSTPVTVDSQGRFDGVALGTGCR